MTAADSARPGPLGPGVYAQITGLTSAVALSASFPPGTGTIGGKTYTNVNVALIVAQDQDVRWRDDGTDPSATVGMLLKKDTPFWYKGDMNKIKFFQTTATAILNVTFYAVDEAAAACL